MVLGKKTRFGGFFIERWKMGRRRISRSASIALNRQLSQDGRPLPPGKVVTPGAGATVLGMCSSSSACSLGSTP